MTVAALQMMKQCLLSVSCLIADCLCDGFIRHLACHLDPINNGCAFLSAILLGLRCG